MAKQEDVFKKVISHAKEYGFIFPSSEIYTDYPLFMIMDRNGAELKTNIKTIWWESDGTAERKYGSIDSAILMHPTTGSFGSR